MLPLLPPSASGPGSSRSLHATPVLPASGSVHAPHRCPAPSSPSPPCPLALGFTFTGACFLLLRSHSCKRSSTCLELKSWTLPPHPALLTYHLAITYVSLSCSFSPGLRFLTTFPRFPALRLSPLLIKHGLDAISQSCSVVPHVPSIDYFQGALVGCSPSTMFDLPGDETKHQCQATLSNAAT